MNSPHVIKFEEFIEDGVKAYLVLEFIDGGCLQDLIDNMELDKTQTQRHFRSLMQGLRYMHG